MKNFQEIVEVAQEKVLARHQDDANVIAIFIFGSAIRGGFDQHSDIDFLVILKQAQRYARWNFTSDDVSVDVIYETQADTDKFLKDEQRSFRRIGSHMLAHGKVLLARDTYAKASLTKAKRNLKAKTRVSKSEVLMHLYSIDDFLGNAERDVERGDSVAFGLDSHLLINNSIELLLKLAGEYLRQPREVRVILKKTDPKYVALLEKFYKAATENDQVVLLRKLATYVSAEAGGPLPENWTA